MLSVLNCVYDYNHTEEIVKRYILMISARSHKSG